ncbi:glycosyltransferase family 2 protein [Undibacterium fentianense]|uniref:Glycosyltransferase family 2 protein n=1 Tax=Undibacterium fentianense TaxID=2828728 RepID=A0A941IG82_9BURK|nr:glycosyltransferase family 2 protein [Undibacterium fentianense]MBR7799755.1 glycosyltransferase family 2 protein [Undibacterium fentianense]
MKTISIVIPVYNEAQMIQTSIPQILSVLDSALLNRGVESRYAIELIAVDDGSVDQTAAVLLNMQQQEPRLRFVRFTRNFGKEAAILAGLESAVGDAIVVIDGDLQHPPELIAPMVRLWESGIFVVHAVKAQRARESLAQKLFAKAFYAVFKTMSGLDLRGHSDFKLMDRKVVQTLLALPERQRFFRGLISWANFPCAQLPFEVADRPDGSDSKWNRWKLIRYAVDNITSFSSLPLKWVTYLGVFTLLFGIVIGSISLVQKIEGKAMDGFTTVNLLIIIMGGAILLSLGVIGHYLARLYDEVKGRPTYLIQEDMTIKNTTIGLEAKISDAKGE